VSRPVIVTGRSRPHELLLLGLSVLTGLAYLLGSPPPGSVVALMPHWQIYLWAFGLLLSGVMGLYGCLWRHDAGLALAVEGAAMLIGAGALLIPAISAAAIGGARALFAAGTSAAWMAANLWRAWQIRGDLKELTP
jgi:hypothetical protein